MPASTVSLEYPGGVENPRRYITRVMERTRNPGLPSRAARVTAVGLCGVVGIGVLLGACSSRAPSPSQPPSNTLGASGVPADLGALVIVTTRAHDDTTPGYVPVSARYPLVDPAHRMPPNTPMRVVDARGTSGTFTSAEPTKIAFGCDGNQLAVTPLTGTTKLSPGIAWALHDASVRPRGRAPIVVSMPERATYAFDELTVIVERDAKKTDRGLLRFLVHGEQVGADGFARTLMDGADPSMAAIDLREGGPSVPVALAAWSIDGSGHAPFLVAIERAGWEGTSLEAWLVEARSAKQIEPMTSYLYQCAF
jgi:hypothetical protein